MWKLVWKGDSRVQTLLLTIHHNEGWEPVVDWWLPRMPSNATQKQVAGLLRQGSVKVVFYLFFICFNILSKNLSILTIDSTHFSPPPQKKKNLNVFLSFIWQLKAIFFFPFVGHFKNLTLFIVVDMIFVRLEFQKSIWKPMMTNHCFLKICWGHRFY